MDRAHWQKIAEERVLEAEVLLKASRWSGAYYLVGYAVECGLKACILLRIQSAGEIIFQDRKFSEKCWTHNLKELLNLAGSDLVKDLGSSPILAGHWQQVAIWSETSRYEVKSRADAEALYGAVTDPTNGVLPWIRSRW